ncbi:glycosyltransferase [Galbibacter sp. PAP.153]|uniref:glycosyltransferase n=1 Tax=Galbibacter sp. PAP.153 TaxID=3104623 RepID=UPI003008AD2E
MNKDTLTLIIPYRNRENHLGIFLKWFKEYSNKELIEVLFIESDIEAYSEDVVKTIPNAKYIHVKESRNSQFHLARYLNIGLNNATGTYICPYDIDLIPYKNSLFIHLERAKQINEIICGYRLDIHEKDWLKPNLNNTWQCSEDSEKALKKHLLTTEKFGVCPIFKKSISEKINGWDENYIGWGGEDQDFIEKYMNATNQIILRSPNILYLHIKHDYEEYWKSNSIVNKNREYYYKKL